jgi:hypothetical protein
MSSCMQFWSVSVVLKHLKFATSSKDLFAKFMPCFRPTFWLRNINIQIVFSGFTPKQTTLLACNRASVFFLMVSVFSPTMLTSSEYAERWCVPFNFSPSCFSWNLPMVYSKAELKNNNDKASTYFSPFWIANFQRDFCLSALHCRFYLNIF